MKVKRNPKTRWSHALSERVRELPRTEFTEIMRVAKEQPGVVSLGPGEPDFDAPKPVINATIRALQEGKTHYSAIPGLKELREAIARKLARENKIRLEDPDEEVIVTAGSSEALLMGLLTLVDAGEEVLVPNPSFLAYTPMVDLVTGSSVPVKLSARDGFQLHPDEIEEKITEKTKVLIINTPSNPTGTVLSKNVLEKIADIAVEHELIVFSDEAYEKFVFGNSKHVSMASLNGMHEHVLTFHSFSKSFAMPGFRIGYAAGHRDLIKEMSKIHIYTTLAASTANQYGALAALQMNKSHVEKMRRSYDARRQLTLKGVSTLNTLHVDVEPEGAFYVFPRITNGKKSIEYVHSALRKSNVLMVPGNEFGKHGEGFVRMSYATGKEPIKEAFERLRAKGF